MGKIMLTGRSILGLEDLTAEEISRVLEMADQMKRIVLSENKKKDYLKGKSLVTVFRKRPLHTQFLRTGGKISRCRCGQYYKERQLDDERRKHERYPSDSFCHGG